MNGNNFNFGAGVMASPAILPFINPTPAPLFSSVITYLNKYIDLQHFNSRILFNQLYKHLDLSCDRPLGQRLEPMILRQTKFHVTDGYGASGLATWISSCKNIVLEHCRQSSDKTNRPSITLGFSLFLFAAGMIADFGSWILN